MEPGPGPAEQLVTGEPAISYGTIDQADANAASASKDRSFSLAPYMAEFVGTCILVFTFGCVAVSPTPSLFKPSAAACIVTVMVYSTATVAGGVAGATALRALFGRDMGLAYTWPAAPASPSLGAAVSAELLYTALLCFLVSCLIVSKRNNPKRDQSQSFGLAIGLFYVAGVLT
ncbi:KIF7 [Symbiodinium natans]|uniref:KIF7 protein n=1 Tax=Symbiodinium natans TaxID=878477 RepID=A0A812R2R2_9DINO|nr:KIF7 [Symbiodinium natans]